MALITAALEPTVVVRAVLNPSVRSGYCPLISLFLSLVSPSTSLLSFNHIILFVYFWYTYGILCYAFTSPYQSLHFRKLSVPFSTQF